MADSGVFGRHNNYIMAEHDFSCVEWLDYYKNEIEKIKETSPLLSVLCIAAGIEFLGKLLSTDPLDAGNCGGKFDEATKTFNSLNKYVDKKLYDLVRCGLAHRISVKDNIILSTDQPTNLDNIPIVLNVDSFFSDFVKAVEEAQSKQDWGNPNANTSYVTIDENTTGSTYTIKYQ